MLRRRYITAGFTLVEVAVVLFLVALLIGAIAVPLAHQFESRRVEDTERMLELAQDKLLAYAARTGYFPCPATDTSNAAEPLIGTDHSTGACSVWHGFLPAATIGWQPVDAQGYALDAWGTGGSRIRYAVSNEPVDGITNPFTKVNGLANAGIGAVSSALLFQICGSGTGVTLVGCGTAPALATNAAVVVWSVGPNATTGGTSIDEAQNPNPQGGSADRIFVSRTRSGGSGPDYDDLVKWIPGPIATRRLQVAGVMTPSGSGTGGLGGGGGNYGINDRDDQDD